MKYSKIMNFVNKPQVTMAILMALFFIPPVLAIWSYAHHGLWQRGASNRGYLIANPPNLASSGLNATQYQGHWNLWVVQPAHCDAACHRNLYAVTQVRKALGKDRLRIARMTTVYNQQDAAALQSTLDKDFPGTTIGIVDKQTLHSLLSTVPNAQQYEEQGGIFIVDPIGNVVLAYQSDEKPSPIFADLRHLLAISRIG